MEEAKLVDQASMGPRDLSRGRKLRERDDEVERLRFNGAARSLARKDLRHMVARVDDAVSDP